MVVRKIDNERADELVTHIILSVNLLVDFYIDYQTRKKAQVFLVSQTLIVGSNSILCLTNQNVKLSGKYFLVAPS